MQIHFFQQLTAHADISSAVLFVFSPFSATAMCLYYFDFFFSFFVCFILFQKINWSEEIIHCTVSGGRKLNSLKESQVVFQVILLNSFESTYTHLTRFNEFKFEFEVLKFLFFYF